MPLSEAKKRANKKWNDENMKERYDRIQLVVPKGEKETIQGAAQMQGQSVNAYIYEAVKQRMEREEVQGGGIRLIGGPSNTEQ